MRTNPRRRAAILLLMACLLLGGLSARGRLDNIRTVDALSLLATGMCFGAALTGFVAAMRQPR